MWPTTAGLGGVNTLVAPHWNIKSIKVSSVLTPLSNLGIRHATQC